MHYFDANANASVNPLIISKLQALLTQYGNASAPHHYGRNIRNVIEQSRQIIAEFFGNRYQVIFTASATEANNLWLHQIPQDALLLLPAIEHPSLVMPTQKLRTENNVHWIKVTADGLIDIADFEDALQRGKADKRALWVSIQSANSETGVVQNISQLAQIAEKYGALLHHDMVQLLGKFAGAYHQCQADFITLSAHKIGGLVGCGALLYRPQKIATIQPQLWGGAQEQRARAGTENYLAIASFAHSLQYLADDTMQAHMLAMRQMLEQGLQQAGAQIIAQDVPRLCNTVFALHQTLQAQQILMQLDLAGIAASAGSACSSGSVKGSPTLHAMGIADDIARCGIRFSFDASVTADAIQAVLTAWQNLRL